MSESMVGSTVSHYRILRKLGAGGMGVVYEAEDSRLGRKVAVKFLSEELDREPGILERFQREARAASALNHPGICTVHAIEQHERQHFIVMELLEGETLAQKMAHGALAVHELLDLGIQIADALESAHAKGIVHRDLKPVNLIVTARGQIKILDFGLAKIDVARMGSGGSGPVSQIETMVDPGQLTVAGTVMGTVYYMSPEQARGQLTDSRTDLFSLGAVLYQMATGELPFSGETQPVVFDAILNRSPRPLGDANPAMPAELGRIVDKAIEKDRALRYQTATELKTDLLRLRRDLDSGQRSAAGLADSKPAAAERSLAVVYFENLSNAKDDEYFRDGITEDVLTELSKIKGLSVVSRPVAAPHREQRVTPAQIARQVGVRYVLTGSIRRAGERLRINTQLVDANTDFPVWSERYDREMQDVFAVQDEIAHKIAEALRITLTPQEKEALAAKPTENLQAYDLFLRGRAYARRRTRQDLEFALQMYENAVKLDPGFAQAYAAVAVGCADGYYWTGHEAEWMERARAAAEKAEALRPDLPETKVAEACIAYANADFERALALVRAAIGLRRDCEGAYNLMLRSLFALGRNQEVADLAEVAIEASGPDYNIYVPVLNALGALGKTEMMRNVRQRLIQAMEAHLRQVPEDARARILLAGSYADEGRGDDAVREASFAMVLRPNDGVVLYNSACMFCALGRKAEALDALAKAYRAGYIDASWVRRDPDLVSLHGEPEFERLYPEPKEAS